MLMWRLLVQHVQADHEKFCRRAKEVQVAKHDSKQEAPAASSSEAASLYKKQDLSLKQGETLKCGWAAHVS
jgi:hypothetical protein